MPFLHLIQMSQYFQSYLFYLDRFDNQSYRYCDVIAVYRSASVKVQLDVRPIFNILHLGLAICLACLYMQQTCL